MLACRLTENRMSSTASMGLGGRYLLRWRVPPVLGHGEPCWSAVSFDERGYPLARLLVGPDATLIVRHARAPIYGTGG